MLEMVMIGRGSLTVTNTALIGQNLHVTVEWLMATVTLPGCHDIVRPFQFFLSRRNPLSRGNPSAVTVGAEMLLERGNSKGVQDWITAEQWGEDQDAVAKAVAPYLR